MPRCAIRRADLRSLWRSRRFEEGSARRQHDAAWSRRSEKSRIAKLWDGEAPNGKAQSCRYSLSWCRARRLRENHRSDPASESRFLQPHPRVVSGAVHRDAGPDREIVDEQNERGADEYTCNESARIVGARKEYQVSDEYRGEAGCAGQRAQ